MYDGDYAVFDFGAGGIDTSKSILVWDASPNNAPEFDRMDVLLSNDGISFYSIKKSEASGFLVGGESPLVEAVDSRSYDGSTFGSSARYLKISATATGFDLNAVVVNGTAVPEPSSSALLGLGALGLLIRRKR